MSYQALYRAYRPQQFKDIVGQDVIVKTLQQAIRSNKISHAYLFSGPRGTGKTSVARILAKAINCDHSQNGEPCQECTHCLDITKGNHPDVIEIDAASNNGVDEIRDIRDKVKFLPGLLKYKVYIIDEVHMLSQGAFNALLKTLEEPPKHVVFILATTEPHKIPPTILSRCQRFDFKSLSVAGIVNKLEEVIEEENIKITEESIITIAENAEGGMRDALSILDQAISFTDEVINVDDVNAVTGSVSIDKIINLAESFEQGDITKALKTVNELLDLGKEASKLVNNLLQFYRDCLLYKNADTKQLNKYIFEKDSFKKLVINISEDKIFYYVNILSDVSHKIRFSNNPRIYLEVALIKMINMESNELETLERITELEHKIDSIALGKVNANNEFTQVFDDEKINALELRLNKVISELNKLELHRLVQRVESFEVKLNDINQVQVQSAVQPDFDFQNQLSDTNLELEALKEKLQSEQNNISTINIEMAKFNQTLIDVRSIIEQKDFSDSERVQFPSVEIDSSIVERIDDLEDKLYKLISGTLQAQTSSVFGRNSKKSSKQITLFGDEIINLDDLKNKDKEDVDFKDIQKEEELINPIKVIEKIDKVEVMPEQEIEEAEPESFQEEEIKPEDAPGKTIEQKATTEQKTSSALVFGDTKGVKEVTVNYQPAQKVVKNSNEYTTYDARIIERILHDSRTEDARKDRDVINHLWRNLDRGLEPSLLSTAEILKEAIVGAVGNKEIILVFDSATTVNQVMRPRFKNLAKKVLDHALSIDIKYYMALPKETWIEKRTEYINQYNIGIKYPTLQPINNPELYEVENEDEYVDDRQKTIDKTIEIFGEDLVKVE